MLMECPQMEEYRSSCGIRTFIQAYKHIRSYSSPLKLYALYLSDSNPDEMSSKALDLYHMYLGWHSKMNIDI